MVLLAIAHGANVTTWDCQIESPGKTFQPHGKSVEISDLVWNGRGDSLASCCVSPDEESANVILTAPVAAGEASHSPFSFRHDEGLSRHHDAAVTARSLSFGGKSRYLCIGDDTGNVCLWDLKKQSRVRHYSHNHDCSLKVSFDPTEQAALYSLTEKELHVFPLRKGESSTTLTASSSLFSNFAVSPLEPSQIVLGCTDGRVESWDVTKRSMITSWSPHSDTITTMDISPINKVLLATASSGNTVAFSDTKAATTIQTQTLEEPVTSLSFSPDGMNIAVGTHSGAVHVYDLRRLDVPTVSWRSETGVAIVALKFAPPGPATGTTGKLAQGSGIAADPALRPSHSLSKEQTSQTRVLVQAELDSLRDDLEQSIRNMHIDMLRKFQSQSDDLHSVIVKQAAAIAMLTDENERLRNENDRLRMSLL